MNLIVEKINIKKTTGGSVETTAIIQEQPSLTDYLNNFVQRLNDKNKSLQEYNKTLLHHNLVIYDTTNVFSLIEHRHFFNYFFKSDVVDKLLESDFREVFLISRIGKREILFPLKRILFLSRIFFFNEVLSISEREIDTEEKYYNWLAEFLTYQGFNDVQIVKMQNEFQVIFGNTGCLLKDLSSIVLKDYNFDKTPVGKSNYNQEFIDETIIKIIQKISTNFGFETEMGQEILRVDA